MEEKRLVPKRRFKGFLTELKEEQFINLGYFGKSYSFARSKEGIGMYHHIHYGDIHTKKYGIINSSTDIPTLSKVDNFEVLKSGDIVIADASEDYEDLGKSVVMGDIENKKIIAGLHTFKFTPNENLSSKYFLYYSQTSYYKEFSAKIGTGTSVYGISKENMGKLNLNLPSVKEQQKIGEFFKVLDDRIANQERKVAKVKALKEAYLTEMFPQEGETLPKRRFKGFEGEWKQLKIKDISPLRGGYGFKSSEFKKSGIPILRISNILSNGSIGGDYIYIDEMVEDSKFLLPNDSIVIAMSGATTGKVATLQNNNQKVYQNQRVGYFQPMKNIDYLFVSTLVKTNLFTKQLNEVLVAGAQPNISSTQIDKFVFLIPNEITEQQKIGSFFKNLDDQIRAEEAKLEKLKKMKEAYLEEMFV